MTTTLNMLYGWLLVLSCCFMTTKTSAVSSFNHHASNSIVSNDKKSSRRNVIEKEVLYNLNPFAIYFETTHHEFFATGEASPFATIKSEISAITGWYLEAYMDNVIGQTGLGFREVASVDLQVSSFRPQPKDDERRLLEGEFAFRAEIYGIVKFIEDDDMLLPIRSQVEQVINELTREAFDHDTLMAYADRLRESTDPVLQNIIAIVVETDIDTDFEPPESNPEDEEGTGGDGGGDSGVQEIEDGGSSGGGGWDTKDYLLCFLMGGFLLGALVCLYMYLSREYHDRKERKQFLVTDHYLDDMNQMIPPRQDQNIAPAANRYLSENRSSLGRRFFQSSDPSQNGSGSNDDIIPIPAPDREQHIDHFDNELDAKMGGQTPRRYINPTSPSEVMYGASYLHDDHMMEQQRQKSKRKRRGRKSVTSTIRPMLAIAEEEQPVLGSPTKTNNAKYAASPDGSAVASWLRQFASYLDGSPEDKHRHPDPYQMNSPTGVDELGVVYRDFPRHDGTPCLMYNPAAGGSSVEHGIEVNENDNGSLKLHEVYIRDASYHSTGSMLSLASTDSMNGRGKQVENFVSKLEHLMVLRQKQYEQRVQMEQEKADFAKKRHETRKPKKNRSSSPQDTNSLIDTSFHSSSILDTNNNSLIGESSSGEASVPQGSIHSAPTRHDVERICLSPTETEDTMATSAASSLAMGNPSKMASVHRQATLA